MSGRGSRFDTVHELSRVDARRIAVRAQLLDRPRPTDLLDVVLQLTLLQNDGTATAPLFALEGHDVPHDALPQQELPPDVAYQIVHDELMIDGNARLNVATFVTTWMEPQAERLMSECFDKNMIDKDEYPQTAEIESRCVRMLSRLWNAPAASEPTGC